MSTEIKDENPTTEVPEEPTADKEAGDDKPEQDGEEKAKDGIDALPEWAQKELTRARTEAANYRTQLREAQDKLSNAKTPEEVDAAISELREQNEKLERAIVVGKVAQKYKLSDLLASRLQGTTEAELEADAALLAKALPPETPTPPSVSGGLDPQDEEDSEIDPRKLAARFRRI